MTPNQIIGTLIEIARAAHTALDDSEARMIGDGSGETEHIVTADNFTNLEAHLAALDNLPEAAGTVMTGPARAKHALQSFLSGTDCRADGRCQYAIDHGAEGLASCPAGKCVMPDAEGGDVIDLAQKRTPRPTETKSKYSANTMYIVATDSKAERVITSSRSTFTPHLDYKIMDAALDFEQAKRLRNVTIPPHKVGQLWMMTDSPLPYQVREIGEGDWEDADERRYMWAIKSPQHDYRLNPAFLTSDKDWMRVLVFAEMKERLALPDGDEARIGPDDTLRELNTAARRGMTERPAMTPCCANEDRSMSGGCKSCGDPCL